MSGPERDGRTRGAGADQAPACPNGCGPMVRFRALPDPRWFWACDRCGRMDEIKRKEATR